MSRATALPSKRPERERRSTYRAEPTVETAVALAEFEALHRIASTLLHWTPGEVGRPQLMPPALGLWYGVMIWIWGSERAVEAELRDRATWERVRRVMARRYPQYQGLRAGAKPMNRSQYRRLRQKYLSEDVLEEALETFRDEAAVLATRLGLLDPETGTNITHPEPVNFVAGDVTVVRSRFKARAGMMHVDPVTGEVLPKLFDSDAGTYDVLDDEGNMIPKVRGIPWMILQARLRHENERVILDVRHVSRSTSEPDAVVESVRALKRRAPGLVGLVYDMAMRGKQREELHQLGFMMITRVPRARRARVRGRRLGTYSATKGAQKVGDVEIWAIEGQPHLREIAAGQVHDIPLLRVQTRIRARKRPNANTGFRWLNEYRIPDAPPVRQALRGARLLIRLDDPNYQHAPYSRADNLHTIAPMDPDWPQLFALRPPTESLNRWIKEQLRDKRAPAVGARRQHFSFVCLALFNNLRAELAHDQRLKLAA